ncbi:MAG: LamG domain-containing protein [Bacteroidales bacterium]|nr:LamG domain-containing protein [Bacteroidales bacterium]
MKKLITSIYLFTVVFSATCQPPDSIVHGVSTRKEWREATNWNIHKNAEQEDSIAQIKSRVESNTSNTTINAGNIASNDSEIATNIVAITGNTGDISSNTVAIGAVVDINDITGLDSATLIAGEDELVVIQSGEEKKVTRDVLQSAVMLSTSTNSSNIYYNVQDISILQSNTSGTSGYALSMEGDTLIVSYGGTTMKFTRTSGTEADVEPPYYTLGEIGNLGYDTASVVFNESLSWTTPDTAFFKVTVDLLNAVITGVYHVDDEIRFKLDSAAGANQSVVVTYTQPGTNRISDIAGNYLLSFSTGITNNVPSVGDTISALAWWKVNNDLIDEENNYNGTGHNTPTFDGTIKQGGSHSVNLNGSKAIDLGNVNLTDSCTIMYWWYGDRDPGAAALCTFANRPSATNSSGIMIWHSSWATDNGFIWVYSGNGTSQEPASCGEILYDNTWAHIAVTFDQGNGEAQIFVDGVKRTSDSTILNNYAISGNATSWGSDNAHGNPSGGRFDDMRIYDRILTTEQILTIATNPEIVLTGTNPGDDPVHNDSIIIISDIDFSTTPIQRGLTEAELTEIYSPTWYLGGESDNLADDVGIVEHSDYRWLRSYHDQNTCCVEYQTSIPSNGGSGLLWTMFMDADRNDYSHGYLNYKVRFPAGFVTGAGGKMPGVSTQEEHPACMTLAPMTGQGSKIGTMYHVNEPGYVDVQWYIYPHLWWDYCYGRSHSRAGSGLPDGIIDRLTMGVVYDLSIRWFAGDVGVRNGFIEWFRDGVLIDQWTGLNFTEDEHINMNVIDFQTFAGGSGTEYYAPSDTYWDITDIKVFQYPPNTEGVPNYDVPSSPDRVLNLPQ